MQWIELIIIIIGVSGILLYALAGWLFKKLRIPLYFLFFTVLIAAPLTITLLVVGEKKESHYLVLIIATSFSFFIVNYKKERGDFNE